MSQPLPQPPRVKGGVIDAHEAKRWYDKIWLLFKDSVVLKTTVQYLTNKRFGTSTGYTTFESDGTMVASGNATTFDDLPPYAFIALKPAGAGADPTLTTFVGNIKQYAFAINDVSDGQTEVTHKYKEGSDITVHLHMATNGVDTTDRTIAYSFEYVVCNTDTSFGYSYPTSSTTLTSADITIPANTPTKSSGIIPIGTISGDDIKIGAYIIGQFKRVAASAGTAPTADPFCTALGFHVEQDTKGSRTLYTK